jgi:protoheme IX farnesyltransferase
VTRFQRLAATTVATVFLLVTIGVVVRATGSGEACPHWPGCFPGQFLPGLDADGHVWIEWLHRTVAAIIGLLTLAMAIVAFRDHRDRRSILWPAIGAVVLVGFQAWLGQETVRLGNSGPSVTAHLAAAMALVGLLVYLFVRSTFPGRFAGRGASQRFTLLAAFGAAATFLVLLFGSNVTARDAALVFPDWPLMNGSLQPIGSDTPTEIAGLWAAHELHRYAAAVVFLILAGVALAAWRARGERPGPARLAVAILGLYAVQIVVGGLQVLTNLAPWTQTLHVAFGALIWGGAAGLAVWSYYLARATAVATETAPGGEPTGGDPDPASRHSLRDTVTAYVALTKPRIIELLLVTTVPAMVLATRWVPGIELGDWLRLTFWTLVCGTLAAGSANAINQYLERDIDGLMARTRRRPLPADLVSPENAMVFGLVLGAGSVALMAFEVNLLAAALTLLAIAFYVVVYTMLLKRTTPQNIVIGGAAGALPPVIGWAAVTGNVGLPALLLFLVVFYWTPPHFWALALRIRADYAAAKIPMLPVVRGIAETSRQIGLYTILLVALTIVFALVARMGPIYLVAAIALGGIFLWRAFVLWRQGTSPERSTAQAIRLYRWSILYLALLFAAIAVDTLAVGPVLAAGKPGYPDRVAWGGIQWQVKTSNAAVGPGPNVFAKANVSVDSTGFLHLRIAKDATRRWTTSEIIGPTSYGYGTYTFTLGSRVDQLDQNVVLGLFTWSDKAPYAHREIDVEVARWGVPTDPTNAQFVVQPYNLANHLVRFASGSQARTVMQFTWRAGRVDFVSRDAATGTVVRQYSYVGTEVPKPGDERVHLNLWLFGGAAPTNGLAAEVVIESFVFAP